MRAAHPHLQVIMLSGQQIPATIVNAVRAGAFDYVVKPDDPDIGNTRWLHLRLCRDCCPAEFADQVYPPGEPTSPTDDEGASA